MAADGKGNLFVGNTLGTVAKYTTSGVLIDASFITGLGFVSGLAIDGDHLYVADRIWGTVGEYSTSGAVINPTLISGLGTISGLALVPEPSAVALLVLGSMLWLGRRRAP